MRRRETEVHDNALTRTLLSHKRSACAGTVSPLPGNRSASLIRLAGAVMCEQDEIRQESGCFTEAKIGELYDEGRTRDRRDSRLGAAGRGGQEDDRIERRARFIDVLSESEAVR